MNYQNIADGFDALACVLSIEKLADGSHGKIRIVTGNQKYIDSIEHPLGSMRMLKSSFVPNSLYTDYLPIDLNFEEYCYKAAINKQCLHAYANPGRFGVWLDMTFLPLPSEEENLCYCLYVMEISKTADTQRMSNVSQAIAASVLDTCLKVRGAIDFKEAMNNVIKDIRLLCKADQCSIILMDHRSKMSSLLCDDTDENSSLRETGDIMDYLTYDLLASWNDTLSGTNCLIVKSSQEMEYIAQRNPFWHHQLVTSHISSFILFPLVGKKELLGFMCATNFNADNTETIKQTLELTTFILATEIDNELMLKQLRLLSSQDMLTGVLNRNTMNDYVTALGNREEGIGKTVGVFFVDLNGLKTINDQLGHTAGDELLWTAAKALKEVFREEEIFRAGGDEFTIIQIGVSWESMERQALELRHACEHYDNISFAIGYHLVEDASDVRIALRKADENMYEDKRKYYEKHPERKRGASKDAFYYDTNKQ